VFVYKLVVEGSIEERMLELQARKKALAEAVLGHDDAAAVKFSEADLRALLAPLA
jgi:SNF2 family DNA or RNA helicase